MNTDKDTPLDEDYLTSIGAPFCDWNQKLGFDNVDIQNYTRQAKLNGSHQATIGAYDHKRYKDHIKSSSRNQSPSPSNITRKLSN